MISKATVLILGAGASFPYGYPLSIDLKKEILKKLKDKDKKTELSEKYGYSDFLIDNFATSFKQSGLDNIEDLLVQRKEFEAIGKHILTEAIREKENVDTLFESEGWYQYLFDQMNDSFETFSKNNLSIITFNFDRSLETFLFGALMNSYNKSHQEITSTLKEIPIIHIYGEVGQISSPRYAEHVTQTELTEASRLMQILDITEADKSIKVLKARELLMNSEVIAFVGFGYNAAHLKMLEIAEYENKLMQGSTFGLRPGEIKSIAKKSGEKIEFPKTKVAQALDAEGFLKESGILGL